MGAGVCQLQDGITVKNSVVYEAAHAVGISHSFGDGDAKNLMFDSIDVERTNMKNLGQSWIRIAIDKRKKPGDGDGGGVYNVRFANINVRDAGGDPSPISGLDSGKMVDGVIFSNIYMPHQTRPAKTFAELNLAEPMFAKGIAIQNGLIGSNR